MLPVPLREENYEAKEEARNSKNFKSGQENIELLLRTEFSANQLRVFGAIGNLCDEVPKDIWALGKLAAPDHLEKMEILADLSVAENSTNAQQR